MRRYQPAAPARHVVIALHGAISHAGWFERLGVALVAHGVELRALDRRGSGEARGLAGRDDAGLVVDDVVRAVEDAGTHAPVTLLGWCWGARPATLAAAQLGAKLRGLVLAAPGLAMHAGLRRRAEEALAAPGDELALPFDDADFSDDPDVVAFITADPLRWHHQPRAFFAVGRQLLARALEALPRLTVPTLTILASGDRVVDNAGVRALLGERPIRELAGGHALVLEHPEQMAAELAAWLDAR